jgi:hypothetical protein
MLLLLTQMVVFGEMHVFLQVRRIGLFGTKRAYHHLEKHMLQEAFLSKTNSNLAGKQCAEFCSI